LYENIFINNLDVWLEFMIRLHFPFIFNIRALADLVFLALISAEIMEEEHNNVLKTIHKSIIVLNFAFIPHDKKCISLMHKNLLLQQINIYVVL